VICAQIGDIKREIVYNGDVLNTTARIEEQCNKYDSELIISGESCYQGSTYVMSFMQNWLEILNCVEKSVRLNFLASHSFSFEKCDILLHMSVKQIDLYCSFSKTYLLLKPFKLQLK